MPLTESSSNSAFKKNIAELVRSKAGTARQKGIESLAKKEGISIGEAKLKQAAAISYAIKNRKS